MRPFRLLLFWSLLAAPVHADIPHITRLAPDVRAALERPASVQLVRSVQAIPASVRSACATVISERKFWLADPGEPFNISCAADDHLPNRRLIWAARLRGYFVVHYESGGIAHSFHIIVVRFPGSQPGVIWRAAAEDDYKDYSAFVHALRRSQLFDYYDYAF